jgi:hypothetical protein
VTNEEQLQWEARFGRPAAVAAFAAGLLLLASTVITQSLLENRKGVEGWADVLLSIDESPGTLILGSVVQALGALCLIPVFYYLFRATAHRSPQIPRWFVYVIVIGPVLFGAAQVVGAVDRVDVAEMFADRDYRLDDPDPERLAEQCPAIRGDVGADCGQELVQQSGSAGAVLFGLLGPVFVAFAFVMVPLRARRAGLLSPFMSILGVIAGVTLVLQLGAVGLGVIGIVVQGFWLGAVGALFLGNWPGGRGPAWESGEPDPWPTAAERRGLAPPPEPDADGAPAGGANGGGPSAPPEPEPVPDRPSSRKRKRKRR